MDLCDNNVYLCHSYIRLDPIFGEFVSIRITIMKRSARLSASWRIGQVIIVKHLNADHSWECKNDSLRSSFYSETIEYG